ncbi:hypothetical protein D9M71_813930 [compost metagenome]
MCRHLDNARLHLAITTPAILMGDQEMGGVRGGCRAGGPGQHMRLDPVLLHLGGTLQAYAVIGLQAGATA